MGNSQPLTGNFNLHFGHILSIAKNMFQSLFSQVLTPPRSSTEETSKAERTPAAPLRDISTEKDEEQLQEVLI